MLTIPQQNITQRKVRSYRKALEMSQWIADFHIRASAPMLDAQ